MSLQTLVALARYLAALPAMSRVPRAAFTEAAGNLPSSKPPLLKLRRAMGYGVTGS